MDNKVPMMRRYAIILIAGQSQRFGTGDKCLSLIHGKPVALYAFETFRRTNIFDRYFFVYRDDLQKQALEKFFQNYYPAAVLSPITWVPGGEERVFSVYHALQVIYKQFSMEAFVFIHDGARPLITPDNIHALNASLSLERGVVLAHRVTDTIMATDAPGDSTKNQRHYLEREKLWALETPQAFYFPTIFEDYKTVGHPTDDSSLFSGTIKILENKNLNLKITAPRDLELVQSKLPILT
ncbi:MAG: 2-C-methyl-D-erythritol 4-phosphate cytidylyltransferase [Puniceicoccales bacterium]|jgi:2-C-methyl-D-erythritol 4-phosphate cytidylyltransferase|nr:2-C-methyl-D-erythritol 4-phosphate cytidylyltransferase [Puniceicoccales bacterium]